MFKTQVNCDYLFTATRLVSYGADELEEEESENEPEEEEEGDGNESSSQEHGKGVVEVRSYLPSPVLIHVSY